jgi:hypothetical protein
VTHRRESEDRQPAYALADAVRRSCGAAFQVDSEAGALGSGGEHNYGWRMNEVSRYHADESEYSSSANLNAGLDWEKHLPER